MYDLIISLGETCQTSMALRYLRLQKESMPFDWSAGILKEVCGPCGLNGKINLLDNYFKDAFRIEDYQTLKEVPDENTFQAIINTKTGLQYLHDFKNHTPIEEQFYDYKIKYLRRATRLYQKISESKNILFVFIARWGELPLDDITHAYKKLENIVHSKFDFLVLQADSSLELFDSYSINLDENIYYIKYNDKPTCHDVDAGNVIMMRKILADFLGLQYINFAYDDITSTNLYPKTKIGRFSSGKSVSLSFTTLPKKDLIFLFRIIPYFDESFLENEVTFYINDTAIKNVVIENYDYPEDELLELMRPKRISLEVQKDLITNNEVSIDIHFKNTLKEYINKDSSQDITFNNTGFLFMDVVITNEESMF